MMSQMKHDCECGSGKQAGSCCMGDEQCACESGMQANQCCFVKDEEEEE